MRCSQKQFNIRDRGCSILLLLTFLQAPNKRLLLFHPRTQVPVTLAVFLSSSCLSTFFTWPAVAAVPDASPGLAVNGCVWLLFAHHWFSLCSRSSPFTVRSFPFRSPLLPVVPLTFGTFGRATLLIPVILHEHICRPASLLLMSLPNAARVCPSCGWRLSGSDSKIWCCLKLW